MQSRQLTIRQAVQIVHDFLERLLLASLLDDPGDGIWNGQSKISPAVLTVFIRPYSLHAAPNREKVKKLEMIKNAKYRAMTARSSRDRVIAPWYLVNRLIMMGKRKPNSAEIVGGSTPDTIEKVLLCGSSISLSAGGLSGRTGHTILPTDRRPSTCSGRVRIRRALAATESRQYYCSTASRQSLDLQGTYGSQVCENRHSQERHRVEKADNAEEDESHENL